MNYRVHPGKEKVFEAAFARVLEAMAGMSDHEETRLYREVAGDREYLIVSRWRREEAFEAFIRSEQFEKITSWGLSNVLSGPPRHPTYREE